MTYDLIEHLTRQINWSANTFGPGARTKGLIDHITKELREIEADPLDGFEWSDVVILGFDGMWRSMKATNPHMTAEQMSSAMAGFLLAKMQKNYARTWPDWRTADPNKAIEHDRTKD